MKQIDMSSKAITRRLQQASELRDLSLSLMKAKKAHDKKMRDDKGDSTETLFRKENETDHAI